MSNDDKLRVIKAIKARCPEGADADEWIVMQLGHIENVQRDLRIEDRAEERERKRHDDALAVINESRKVIRAGCPHVWKHYVASGFADFSECVICGEG